MSVKLYKYVSAERINVLKNGTIRFTQPSGLNDPFDMQFRQLEDLIPEETWGGISRLLDSSIEDGSLAKEAANEKVREALKVDWDALPEKLKHDFAPHLETIEAYAEAYFGSEEVNLKTRKQKVFAANRSAAKQIAQDPSSITESIGVLSLTERTDNLLMWSHYTNSHQGFVIELDSEHSFFTKELSGITELRKIEYVEKRRLRTLLDEGNDPFRAFFLKSLDWKYESEWRLIRPLEDADERFTDKETGEDICLFKLPADCITGIILGLNMNTENRTKILELIEQDSRYKHVQVLEALPDYEEDRVKIKPATV